MVHDFNFEGLFSFIKNFESSEISAYTLLNKVCFHNTPSEFLNTPRCVVVTHLFTVLFHSSRKHTIVCKETHKVYKNYTPLCLLITHL